MTQPTPSTLEQFDDVTAVEVAPASSDDDRISLRDVQLFDFRDGATTVAVEHGPLDRSRIWLSLRTETTIVYLSVEEGVARQLASRLADILPNFKTVRFGAP
jgi:hypothetical protein